jgi:hypothetical protein
LEKVETGVQPPLAGVPDPGQIKIREIGLAIPLLKLTVLLRPNAYSTVDFLFEIRATRM